MNNSRRSKDNFRPSAEMQRAAKFVGVGVLNTAIDICVFSILHYYLAFSIVMSNVIAVIVAASNAYLLCNRFVFADTQDQEDSELKKMRRYTVVVAISSAISTAVVYVCALFVEPIAGKVLATGASFVFNYSGMRLFAFAAQVPEPQTRISQS